MNSVAIRVEGLSKRYRIGARGAAYATLRESVARLVTSPARRWKASRNRDVKNREVIWALKDLTCEIERGVVTAIIGRNGAGKSTLLKILARITSPTAGTADVYGRVGSLLEVGTGFHAELTGRENIFLNGAILGMKRAEIRRKFDAIVNFAEVEKFIDTPVKRYSSGMHMRLAFAVAAHLDPEILLVDEVLAVGDAKFQQKCIGKMETVAHEGRTVLFVSHNMAAVRALCTRGIVLEGGSLAHQGDVGDCIQQYYRALGILRDAQPLASRSDGAAGSVFGPVSINGRAGNTIQQGEELLAETNLYVRQAIAGFNICCIVEDTSGRRILRIDEDSVTLGLHSPLRGSYRIAVALPPLWLSPGIYSLFFGISFRGDYEKSYFYHSDAFPLDVSGASPRREAVLHPPSTWTAALHA